MLESLTLEESVWRDLALHARERGLVFLSTAFDLAATEAPGVALLHCVTAYPAPIGSSAVRAVEAGLGDGIKRPVEAEKENLRYARRSHHAVRKPPAGRQDLRGRRRAAPTGGGIAASSRGHRTGRREADRGWTGDHGAGPGMSRRVAVFISSRGDLGPLDAGR